VAEPDAVTLDGKSSPKLRRRSKQAITPEQQEIFFDALADSCNVDLSARRAGFPPAGPIASGEPTRRSGTNGRRRSAKVMPSWN